MAQRYGYGYASEVDLGSDPEPESDSEFDEPALLDSWLLEPEDSEVGDSDLEQTEQFQSNMVQPRYGYGYASEVFLGSDPEPESDSEFDEPALLDSWLLESEDDEVGDSDLNLEEHSEDEVPAPCAPAPAKRPRGRSRKTPEPLHQPLPKRVPTPPPELKEQFVGENSENEVPAACAPAPAKRARGRPRKTPEPLHQLLSKRVPTPPPELTEQFVGEHSKNEVPAPCAPAPAKRARGRPRKTPEPLHQPLPKRVPTPPPELTEQFVGEHSKNEVPAPAPAKRARGRPRKTPEPLHQPLPKRVPTPPPELMEQFVGEHSKNEVPAPCAPAPAKRPRGRPRKKPRTTASTSTKEGANTTPRAVYSGHGRLQATMSSTQRTTGGIPGTGRFTVLKFYGSPVAKDNQKFCRTTRYCKNRTKSGPACSPGRRRGGSQ